MYHIKTFNTDNDALAEIAFSIRQKVFVDEQKVDAREEYDEHEKESTHYLLSKDEHPIGTARWRHTDQGIKLERFAVLKEHRGEGAGSFLVNAVLQDVLPFNKKLYLHSQVTAVNLYKRAGFVAEGQLFYEANIAHYKMVYKK